MKWSDSGGAARAKGLFGILKRRLEIKISFAYVARGVRALHGISKIIFDYKLGALGR
jgi:hypothetical protein